MKLDKLFILVFCLLIINCSNSNLINNSFIDGLSGKWNLHSVEIEEVETYYNFLSEKNVTDTVMIKYFADKQNNWT